MQREREVAWVFETKNPTTTTWVIPRSLAFGRRQKEAGDGQFKKNIQQSEIGLACSNQDVVPIQTLLPVTEQIKAI